jgi:hypothetical protein
MSAYPDMVAADFNNDWGFEPNAGEEANSMLALSVAQTACTDDPIVSLPICCRLHHQPALHWCCQLKLPSVRALLLSGIGWARHVPVMLLD